eukprot:m.2369 g.2369  ORF g.2369 m.2369 type:complete len:693 (+) comp8613_c0_seq1:175-2253(+)
MRKVTFQLNAVVVALAALLIHVNLLMVSKAAIMDPSSVSSSLAKARIFILGEGNRLQASCLRGSVSSSFAGWRKAGKPIKTSWRTTIRIVDGYYVLAINGVVSDDEGIFECIDNRGVVSERIKLIVAKWQLRAKEDHVNVMVGRTARLHCSFSDEGATKGHIMWRRNNRPVFPNERRKLYRYGNGKKGSLVINNVQLSDAGTYDCQGGPLHNLSATRDTIRLKVYAPPKILNSSPQIKEEYFESNVKIFCHVSGYPQPNITWIKRSRDHEVTLGTGQELVLSNISNNDTAMYICNVTNKHGSANSFTRLFGKASSDKKIITLPQDGVFHVLPFQKRHGNIQQLFTTVSCFKDDKEIEEGYRYKFCFPKFGFLYLAIYAVDFDSTGNYTCVIKSKESGRILQESSSRLEVYGAPPEVLGLEAFFNCSHVMANFSLPKNITSRPLDGFLVKLWKYNMRSGLASSVFSTLLDSWTSGVVVFPSSGLCTDHNGGLALEISSFGSYGIGLPAISNLKRKRGFTVHELAEMTELISFPESEFVIKSSIPAEHLCNNHKTRNSVKNQYYRDQLVFKRRRLEKTLHCLSKQNISVQVGSIQTQKLFSVRLNVSELTLVDAVEKIAKLTHAIDHCRPIQLDECSVNITFSCILGSCSDDTFEEKNDVTVEFTYSRGSQCHSQWSINLFLTLFVCMLRAFPF